MKKPSTPYPIWCSVCGGRLRWRWVWYIGYPKTLDEPGGWHLPKRCSHCGMKAQEGESIQVTTARP